MIVEGYDMLVLSAGAMVASLVGRLLNVLLAAACALLMDERVYDESVGKMTVLPIMRKITEGCFFAERHEMFDDRMCPGGTVLGLSFVARVSKTARNECSVYKNVTVRVSRWRWLPPLVPDDETNASAVSSHAPGTIVVMRSESRSVSNPDWVLLYEVACPPAISPVIADAARAVARTIAAAAAATGQVRVVLSGPPGCGKSTTARLVALALNAWLVPTFDPTLPGTSVLGIVKRLKGNHPDRHVVLCMDEFDVALRRIAVRSDSDAATAASADAVLPEVTDKTSWNAMLDMLQFLPSVTLVMTTNLPFSTLDEIDTEHCGGALLRKGRITDRLAMHQPFGKSLTKRKKNQKLN
jgi:hypothetical protein